MLIISLNMSAKHKDCDPALVWGKFASESQVKEEREWPRKGNDQGKEWICLQGHWEMQRIQQRKKVYSHLWVSYRYIQRGRESKKGNKKKVIYIYIYEWYLGSSGFNCSPEAKLLLVHHPLKRLYAIHALERYLIQSSSRTSLSFTAPVLAC